MTPEKAREKADTIISLFWNNFLKSEPAFVMRDVIAIALQDATAQVELTGRPEVGGVATGAGALGEDEHGRAMKEAYLARIAEILKIMQSTGQ